MEIKYSKDYFSIVEKTELFIDSLFKDNHCDYTIENILKMIQAVVNYKIDIGELEKNKIVTFYE